jgi:peptide methionine sulfoxide reductase MsrB
MKASNLGRHGKGSTMFPIDETGKYMPAFSADDVKVFDVKPHWLKGYKEIIQQPSTQRPNLLHLGISPEQQELLNLHQVNNTTMLSSVAPTRKLKFHGEDYRSPAGLPSYMEPTLYSQEEMARRMTPYQQALMRINQTEKAADRVIQRTTDDKVYYDLDGNILKTPLDNY